jgi:hypothetical protein
MLSVKSKSWFKNGHLIENAENDFSIYEFRGCCIIQLRLKMLLIFAMCVPNFLLSIEGGKSQPSIFFRDKIFQRFFKNLKIAYV